jgi:hypothetical protein
VVGIPQVRGFRVNANDLFDRLMAINREAFGQGVHETAYHALMAALHLADHEHNVRRAEEVGRVAAEQGKWINEHHPGHKLSSQSASARGNAGVFDTLQVHVTSVLQRIEAERVRQHVGHGPRAGGR